MIIPKILSRQRHTIVPRAANSKTLVEQSVGRGLRLPYGRRTGVFAVDRLNIISHDRFDEIINAANDPNSIIRAKVVIGRDIPDKAQKTVQLESNWQPRLRLLTAVPPARNRFSRLTKSERWREMCCGCWRMLHGR